MSVTLYIDTGGARPGLAARRVTEHGSVRYAETAPLPYGNSGESFFSCVRGMLRDTGAAFDDISAIYAYTGPGGFTGLRIGLSAAAGMRAGGDIPLYGIDGFTRAAFIAPESAGYAVVIPAGRHMVYAAALHADYSIHTAAHMLPEADIQRFADETRAVLPGASAVTVASPAGVYPVISDAVLVAPGVRDVMDVALRASHLCTEGADVLPIYVRPPDAKPQPYALFRPKK